MSKILLGIFIVHVCAASVFGVAIISKEEWHGAAAESKLFLPNNLTYAIIHHTAGAYCSTKSSCIPQMKNIQYYHQTTLGWADIGYHFLIGGDGNIYEGRGWNVVGAHAKGWNFDSIGISFMGNYNNDKVTAEQITAALSLLDEGVNLGKIKSNYTLYGHRQVGNTECPGNNLYNEIKQWSNWKARTN